MELNNYHMTVVSIIVILLILLIPDSESHCNRHKDCLSCTNHKTWSREPCRWCPLDRACHAKWSPRNHCQRRQNIKHPAQCAHPNNVKYDPGEAYKLALFSAIAYSDEPQQCLAAIFPDKDYKIDAIVMYNCDDFLLEYDKHCLAVTAVSHKDKEIIVAYRGTRGSEQLIDQTLLLMTLPKVPSSIGGKVQAYFYHINKRLYKPIKNSVRKLTIINPGYYVKFTGHSLGGAAASIASAMLVNENIVPRKNVSLYTFGMPRVGNKDYAQAHDKLVPDSWRIVRTGDIVARFPVCSFASCSLFNGPYHHKTKVLYSTSNMTINSEYTICKGNEESTSKCKQRSKSNPFHKYLRRHRNTRSLTSFNVVSAHKEFFGIPIGTYCINDVLG